MKENRVGPRRALFRGWMVLALVAGGCDLGSGGESEPDPDGKIDAPLPDAGSDAGSLVFAHDWTEEVLCHVEEQGPNCCEADRVELPSQAASVLDLRHLAAGSSGTCSEPTKLTLPAERARYPLKVLLPAVSAPDPACDYCSARGKTTTFGIVLEVPLSLSASWHSVIVAPPPWRYVYDHNSLEGDACLGGYQEFGERACVRIAYGGYIGFATGQVDVAPAVALIDLAGGEVDRLNTCCPFLPTTP